MQQEVNRVYAPLFKENPRYFILLGGRGAGRSTVASQYALSKLIAPGYFRCAIMRYILGDIRNSIYREIKDRADENGILENLKINDSSMVIEYGRNTINAVGFKKSSGDQKAKLKSLANYNCVIIEEADEIPEADFMQLDDSLRTLKGDITIILLLNPPAKTHWIVKRFFNLLPSEMQGFYIPQLKETGDTVFIHTNYQVNAKNISPQTIQSYENYRFTNPSHYWTMVKGLIPETVKGKIYSGWREVDAVPHEARLMGYGLDFGFDPDPAAIVALYYHNGGYIADEILYQRGLLDEHLAKTILALPKAPTIADSAEPKAIAGLRGRGISILEAQKGPGSVEAGIKHVQGLRISYTKRSENLRKEYENYAWKRLKDAVEDDQHLGIEDPVCENHLMSAMRYALTVLAKPRKDDDFYDNLYGRKVGQMPRERKNLAV